MNLKTSSAVTDKLRKCLSRVHGFFTCAKDKFNDDPIKWSIFVWLTFVIAAMMFGIIIGDRGKSLIDTLMLLSAMFFAGALGYRKRLLHGTGSVLLLVYAIWLMATRLLHGDQSLLQSAERIGMAFFAVVICYALPFLFTSKKSRRKLVLLTANITVGFCALCGLLCLLIVVFGVEIRLGNALNFSDWIHVIAEGDFEGRLRFSGHPTLIANMICLGVASALYCAMEVRGKVKKVLYIIAVLLMLPVLPMTDTRSCSVVCALLIAVSAAMTLFGWIQRRIEIKASHRALQIAGSLVCFVAMFAGAFAYIDGQRDTLEAIGGTFNSVVYENSEKEDADSELSFSDRGYEDAEEMASMSGRSTIYKKAFETLAEDPEILLFGELYNEREIQLEGRDENGEIEYWHAVHWHNSFIEVVFETGIVGLVLVAAFVVLVLIKMIKIFFGSFEKYSIADKFMMAIPAVALLASMLEPVLFSILEQYFPKLIYVLFLVWCGIIMSEDKNESVIK